MNKIILIPFFILLFQLVSAQTDSITAVDELTLEQVISLASKYSPDAKIANQQFYQSYWTYRNYKADRLPQLMLNSTLPNLNRSLAAVMQPDGSEDFVYRNTMQTSVNTSLTQPVLLTGGKISVSSNLQRIDQFGDEDTHSYMATPLSVSFNQSLNGYNEYKWRKKIDPLKYEKDKKEYLSKLEDVSIKAIESFFQLASAQLNNDIAKVNYQNADTLYKIGQGRYNIGTIAEDELLQLELSLINSKVDFKKSELEVQQKRYELLNFLGFDKTSNVRLIMPDSVPGVQLQFDSVMNMALNNNPDVISQKLQMIEAESSLAQQKANKGFQADLMMQYQLNQTHTDIEEVYKNPEDGQMVQLGIAIPLVDWGKGKRQYKIAKSSMEITRINIEQAEIQFEQNIFNDVMNFNFQNEQFLAARKADTVAEMRFFISKQRYLIGKISILELNTALTQRDGAKRSLLSSIQSYWQNYYRMRKLTLYDFVEQKEISVDFDAIEDEL